MRLNEFSDQLRLDPIQYGSIASGAASIFSTSTLRRAHVPLDVKLVATIGLSVAIAACAGLALVLFLLSDGSGGRYGQVIGVYGRARQSLGPAMLVFGLAMVGFAGITAWVFSLYASFRIAGPLYRISRDLEQQMEHGPIAPTPIRTTDRLQREWQEFDAGVAALRAHYAELRQALSQVDSMLRADAADPASLLPAIVRLKNAEQHVRL